MSKYKANVNYDTDRLRPKGRKKILQALKGRGVSGEKAALFFSFFCESRKDKPRYGKRERSMNRQRQYEKL